MKSSMNTIIVLSDGETWNTITGCSICVITNEEFELLCLGSIDVNDLNPVSEIMLKEFTV